MREKNAGDSEGQIWKGSTFVGGERRGCQRGEVIREGNGNCIHLKGDLRVHRGEGERNTESEGEASHRGVHVETGRQSRPNVQSNGSLGCEQYLAQKTPEGI